MALDINGYNATFKAFTDFATQSVEAGKSKAVARCSTRWMVRKRPATSMSNSSRTARSRPTPRPTGRPR